MSGTMNSAGFAPNAPSTADRPNSAGANFPSPSTGYDGFQMPTASESLAPHITTPSPDGDRNGGISWGPSSPINRSSYPGIDGNGTHQWEGHHPGIPAMHSTGHAGSGPSSDGGVMRGLPGIDGNIAYDGSDIRQGY